VRQALRLGLDRERIKQLHYTDGTFADTVVSTAFSGYHADLTKVAFDPTGAERLLEEAGWTRAGGSQVRRKGGQDLRFTHYAWPSTQWQDMAAIAQANWKAIGADVKITAVENAQIPKVLSGAYGVAPLGWGLTSDPIVGLNLLFHSTDQTYLQGSTFNVFHYDKPEVDTLISQALTTADVAKRQALAAKIQQYVYDDVPFIPVAYPAYELVSKKSISLDETGDGHLSGVGEAYFMDRWKVS